MYRLLKVFLLIESIAVISLLSIYSISGLLKESQVDIDSSKEIEKSSDLLGETSMQQGTETAAAIETFSSLLGLEITLQAPPVLDFAFKDAGEVFPEKPALLLETGGPFFTLAILFENGAYIYKIRLGSTNSLNVRTNSPAQSNIRIEGSENSLSN
jgi:hypothetical protein